VCAGLEAVITHHIEDDEPVIIEGAWILPEFVARAVARHAGAVAAAYIVEPDEDEVRAAMQPRSKTRELTPPQRAIAAFSWRFGLWLGEGARSFGLPVVDARPRETLVTRCADLSPSRQTDR
jgi:2-phosphoglycerate kinase